jgi:hypothetical protein
MTLQERIQKNEQYFKGMEIINNTVIIKVLYGDKWGAYPSQDEKVKVAKSEEIANEWFYYGDYTYTIIDEIFDLIEETIDMNLSAIERLELFNQKINELKEIFANESLQRLKTLVFHFEEIKKPKRKKNKKNIEEAIIASLPSNTIDLIEEDAIIDCTNNKEETVIV